MTVTAEQAAQTWAVRVANVGEYWIGDQRFHGDWYGYGDRWSRVILAEGTHRVRVRLASEVRLFGGAVPPSLTFVLQFRAVDDVLPLAHGRIEPELLDGQTLVSSLASVPLFNGAAATAVVTGVAVNNSRVTLAP